MRFPLAVVFAVLFGLPVPVIAMEDEFSGVAEARAVAVSIAARVFGQDSGNSNVVDPQKGASAEMRMHPFMGGTFEITVGELVIGVSERGSTPVTLSRPECKPETWPRLELTNSGSRLLTPEELRERYVHASADQVYEEAVRVARLFVGEEEFNQMGEKESGLTDQGNSFAFTYKWLKEDFEENIRVGLHVLKIWANPVDGCVYRVSHLKVQPDRVGLVSREQAIKTAESIHRRKRSDEACSVSSGALIEKFEAARTSRKYWAFIFKCEPTNIKIDAVTGDFVDECATPMVFSGAELP